MKPLWNTYVKTLWSVCACEDLVHKSTFVKTLCREGAHKDQVEKIIFVKTVWSVFALGRQRQRFEIKVCLTFWEPKQT